jgi:urease accessory protein
MNRVVEPDSRQASAVGRHARLEIVFERRRSQTVIAHAYAEPPFRIGRAFAIDDAAYVIIVCSGPGVFAGDSLHQSVRVERGARVVLTSQSALQVHPSAESIAAAVLHHEYRVDDDGELHCHWDPVIPFADAALVQQFDLALHPDGRLYWSDALMSGRASRGEAWRFRELTHALSLRVGDSLKYLERYTIAPGDRDATRTWVAGDANYLATALVHHPRVSADEVEALHRQLAAVDDVRAAVDLLDSRLMIARLASACGAPFAAARTVVRHAVLHTVFQSSALAGRK